MKKKRRIYYRKPKTTQEIRSYYGNEDFVRAKRRPRNLPTSWDDLVPSKVFNDNWKLKRKTQYRENSRSNLTKHKVTLNFFDAWNFYRFLQANDTPFKFNGRRWMGSTHYHDIFYWSNNNDFILRELDVIVNCENYIGFTKGYSC